MVDMKNPRPGQGAGGEGVGGHEDGPSVAGQSQEGQDQKAAPPTADEIRRELEALPADWMLTRVGPDKRPLGGENWYENDRHSPDDAIRLNTPMPPAWGLLSGPASGVIVLDLDAGGWRKSFQQVTGHPITDLPPTISWTSGKPGRSGHAFAVPNDLWPELTNRRVWKNAEGETCWELRGDRHQAVILGVHPETGRYRWLPGRSPQEIPDPAQAPDWLLEALLVQEHPQAEPYTPTEGDAERAEQMLRFLPPQDFTSYDSWLRVGMALHNTDPGLLSAWVEWSRGMGDAFDEVECLRKWDSFTKSNYVGRPVTLGTLIHLAKQYGYRPPVFRTESGDVPSEPDSFGDEIPTYSEIVAKLMASIERQDRDTEMELRAELKQRFRVNDEQITGELFALLSRPSRTRPSAVQQEGVDLSTVQPLEYLIPGYAPVGDVGLLYGPKNAGKTTLALHLADRHIRGLNILDRDEPHPPGKVLFIATDSGLPPLVKAAGDLGIDLVADPLYRQGDPHQRFWAWGYDPEQGTEAWVCDIRGLTRLRRFIEEHGITLVLIDSAKSVSSAAGWSYSLNEAVKPMLKHVREVCQATGCCVMFLSHDGTTKGSHAGAKAWAEEPSLVVQLVPIEDPDTGARQGVRLQFIKDRAAAVNPCRRVAYVLCEGELELLPETEVIGNCIDAILEVLWEAELSGTAPLSTTGVVDEVMRRFGRSRKTVENSLARITGTGKERMPKPVHRPRRGRYALTPAEAQRRKQAAQPETPATEEEPRGGEEEEQPQTSASPKRNGDGGAHARAHQGAFNLSGGGMVRSIATTGVWQPPDNPPTGESRGNGIPRPSPSGGSSGGSQIAVSACDLTIFPPDNRNCPHAPTDQADRAGVHEDQDLAKLDLAASSLAMAFDGVVLPVSVGAAAAGLRDADAPDAPPPRSEPLGPWQLTTKLSNRRALISCARESCVVRLDDLAAYGIAAPARP